MTTGKVPLSIDLYGKSAVERYDITGWMFFVLLIVQTVVYPILAILSEKVVHGINSRGRSIVNDKETSSAVRMIGLTKVYPASWWSKVLCCRRRTPGVRALDELDLVAPKRQILCLLGVNGAGKSTTLDLLSGFSTPSSGSMEISSSGAPLGICPQKNVIWDKLTVLEHVNFWSELKSGRRSTDDVDGIILKCGLEEKRYCCAGKLSGGQKRKLQLACMFVGGSTVCLMDEVTTGLVSIKCFLRICTY
jgi:ABC-type transport system involved in cytochrome c biogenesis ATPase subunit